MGSILYNVFLTDLDDGIQCTHSKCVDDTKLGGVADRPDGSAALQRDLTRREKWADRNLMKFHKGKSQLVPLGRNNPSHQNRLETDHQEGRFAEKAGSWNSSGIVVSSFFPFFSPCVLQDSNFPGMNMNFY